MCDLDLQELDKICRDQYTVMSLCFTVASESSSMIGFSRWSPSTKVNEQAILTLKLLAFLRESESRRPKNPNGRK